MTMTGTKIRSATRVPLTYALVGLAWIVASDFLVTRGNPAAFWPEVLKGSAFVLVSALLLHLLLRRDQRRLEAVQQGLVAARDQVEAAAHLSEVIERAVPAGIVVVDVDGIIQDWNPTMERTFGWRASEVIGRPFPGMPADEVVERRALFRRVTERGRPERFTAQRARRDGTLLDVLVDVAPLADRLDAQGRPMLVTSLTDVSELESLRRVLASASERWRLGLEAIGEGIFEWDIGSDEIRRSPFLLAMLDEPPEAELATATEMWRLVWPDDVAALAESTALLLGGEAGGGGTTLRIATGQVPLRWLRISAVMTADAEGRPARVVGAVRDVTGETVAASALRVVAEMHEGLREREPYRTVVARVCAGLCAPLGMANVVVWDSAASGEAHCVAAAADCASSGIMGLELLGDSTPSAHGALGTAITAGRTVIVDLLRAEAASGASALAPGIATAIGIPIRSAGRVIGAITTYSGSDRSPDSRIVAAVESVAVGLGALHEAVAARDRLALRDAALQSAANGIVVLEPDGIIAHANRAFADMVRTSADSLQGERLDGLFAEPESAEERCDRETVLARGDAYRGERVMKVNGDEPLPVRITISPIELPMGLLVPGARAAGQRAVAIVEDLSERVAHQANLAHLSRFDALTGLPNRTLFTEQARAAVERAKRSEQSLAVLFLNLDKFKHINDSLGRAGGDAVLRGSADRLSAHLRPTDLLARLGGDEFAILLSPVRDAADAGVLCQRLLGLHETPLDAGGFVHHVGLSIGVAMYPGDGTEVDELVQHADLAMYRAKADGRQALHFFSPKMNTSAVRRGEIERALHSALKRDEIRVVYQPQIRLADDTVVGAEALARWRSAELGDVSPFEFISVAEDIGLIRGIGIFVFREAARQLLAWDAAGLPPLRIAVNLSMAQFRSATLAEELRDAIAEIGVDPSRIELELTESMLAENAERADRSVRALHDARFALAIDDFGTGYSSMFALRRYPLARLKVDRSFVMDLENDPSSAAIVQATIGLAHSLGLSVIAEGVETAAQEAFLRDASCDEVQGYRFAKPLEVEAVAPWVRAWTPPARGVDA